MYKTPVVSKTMRGNLLVADAVSLAGVEGVWGLITVVQAGQGVAGVTHAGNAGTLHRAGRAVKRQPPGCLEFAQ